MDKANRSIALIEDRFILDCGLKAKLEDEGFDVVSVPREASVVEKIAAAAPGIVITDLDRDDPLDPLRTITSIKNGEEFRETEIFVLTEELDVKTEIALRKLRVNSFFMRSSDLRYIIEAAHTHFNPPAVEEEDVFESTRYEDDDAPPENEEGGSGDSFFSEFNEMLNDFQDGIAKHLDTVEDPHETHYNNGLAYMERNELDKALEEFSKSRLSPRLEEKSIVMIGSIQRRRGEYYKALDTFKQGYDLVSAEASKLNFRYELAETLLAQKRRKDAYNMFASVFKADRNFRDVRSRLVAIKDEIEKKNGVRQR